MKKWKNILITIIIISSLSVSTTLSTLAQKMDYAGTLTTVIDSDILTLNPWFWGMSNEGYIIDHIYEPMYVMMSIIHLHLLCVLIGKFRQI
ncbi:MAG: hypothetical protein HGN29_09535 [Asgard group archaeon]|nr:hypothetical protein [Asgard group archaeon]